MMHTQIRSLDHRRRIGQEQTAPYLYHDGTGDNVAFGSDASIDDIFAADCTVEIWFRRPIQAVDCLLHKNSSTGWLVHNAGGSVMRAELNFTGGKIYPAVTFTLNKWQHLAFVYDHATLTCTAYIDGVAGTPATATGAYQTDAAKNLNTAYDGSLQHWTGDHGWIRLSNVKRYTANFDPPSRFTPPAVDVNTIEQWNIDEGSGSTAAAQVNSPANDGTITGCTWMEG